MAKNGCGLYSYHAGQSSSPRFGMTADKFGVSWMILVAPAEQSSKAA